MRSRISRMCTRASALSAGFVVAVPACAQASSRVLAQASPLDTLSMPVGLSAVGLGVVGMVAGAFRKKKVQPENERRN